MNFKQYYYENKKYPFTIYVDLDSVLADWEGAFKKLSAGKSYDEFKEEGKEGEAWKLIHKAGKDWWANIPWLDDGKKLWNFVKEFKPTILTSPGVSNIKPIIEGKNEWIDRELGEDVPRIIDKDKGKYADKNVLVDDTKKNIDNWKENGGKGILYTSADDAIGQLKKVLDLEEDLSTRYDSNSKPEKNFNKKKFFNTKQYNKKSHVTVDMGSDNA